MKIVYGTAPAVNLCVAVLQKIGLDDAKIIVGDVSESGTRLNIADRDSGFPPWPVPMTIAS
jgi:hypothetical protein